MKETHRDIFEPLPLFGIVENESAASAAKIAIAVRRGLILFESAEVRCPWLRAFTVLRNLEGWNERPGCGFHAGREAAAVASAKASEVLGVVVAEEEGLFLSGVGR